jgi:hypothetical protein
MEAIQPYLDKLKEKIGEFGEMDKKKKLGIGVGGGLEVISSIYLSIPTLT